MTEGYEGNRDYNHIASHCTAQHNTTLRYNTATLQLLLVLWLVLGCAAVAMGRSCSDRGWGCGSFQGAMAASRGSNTVAALSETNARHIWTCCYVVTQESTVVDSVLFFVLVGFLLSCWSERDWLDRGYIWLDARFHWVLVGVFKSIIENSSLY